MTRYRATVSAVIPYSILASPETLQPHCLDRQWPQIGDRTVQTSCEAGMVLVAVTRTAEGMHAGCVATAAVAAFDAELQASGLLRRGGQPGRLEVQVVEIVPDEEIPAA